MQNRFLLPNDIFISLCSSFLSIQDILNLSLTSKAHYQFTSTPCLWQKLETRDFYFTSKDGSITSYKEKKLGISREKERYIDYMTALSLITTAVEQAPDYKSQPIATREYRKKNAIQAQLDNPVLESDDAFKKAYKALIASVELNQLIEIRAHWNKLYILFLSTDNIKNWFTSLFNDNKSQEPTENKKRTNNILLELAFLPLCRLDASLSLSTLIHQQDLWKQNEYLFFAFNYPCIKTIHHLLNARIELNEKNWVINGTLRMHITPIMLAALGMSEGKQVTVYKEMISLLLQHGANTKLSVFITDDDWKTEEEYQQRSKSIVEWCQLLLDNKMDNFKSKDDKNIFKETMRMIINHTPEKNISLTKRRICSIQ